MTAALPIPSLALLALALAWTPRAVAAAPPTVELWTIGTGEDLYARFGHTAVRVHQPGWRDRVYNYGTTDFSRPDLVTSFMTGEAEFWLGVSDGARSERVYRGVDRSIEINELLLPPAAARALAAELDAEAADRAASTYQYHHFLDNCATRVRDRLDEVSGGAIRAVTDRWRADGTFRDLARRGFADLPWLLVGTDLVLGRPADRAAEPWDACFLPATLQAAVLEAEVRWPDGTVRPLAGPTELRYERQGPAVADADPRFPVRMCWMVAGILVLLAVARWLTGGGADGGPRRSEGLVLVAVGVVAGLVGAAVAVVAWMSVQAEVRRNETLAWAWPLDLWLVVPGVGVLLGRRRLARVAGIYALVRVAAVGIVALGHVPGWLIQPQLHLLALWAGGFALVAAVTMHQRASS